MLTIDFQFCEYLLINEKLFLKQAYFPIFRHSRNFYILIFLQDIKQTQYYQQILFLLSSSIYLSQYFQDQIKQFILFRNLNKYQPQQLLFNDGISNLFIFQYYLKQYIPNLKQLIKFQQSKQVQIHNKFDNMHSKNISNSTTTRSTARPSTSIEAGLLQENRMIRLQAQSLRQQLNKTKKQMLNIYEQNVQLRQMLLTSKQANFMKECEQQIKRLKKLVQQLTQARSIGSNQRQQIKDRIIMKLQDQLISVKIQLKQAKYKNLQ